jgi:hypothetical protein
VVGAAINIPIEHECVVASIYMAYSGRWYPQNPGKYQGDVNNIVYRSLWERTFFTWCDTTPEVLEWSSEEIIIPYRSPLDKKLHRYFPDVFLKVKQADGSIKSKIVEIKPAAQCVEPVKPKGKRTSKKYIREVTTYLVNQAKWNAAKEVCRDKGWDFETITEHQLYHTKRL